MAAYNSWGTALDYREEAMKRGLRLTTPVVINTNVAKIALEKSAPHFLAYCAFARFARSSRALLSQRSFLLVLRFPVQWESSELVEMAKLILRDSAGVVVNYHPPKGTRGHEIDADELLRVSRLIFIAREDTELHPDIDVACTFELSLDVNRSNHFDALAKLLGCGALSNDEIGLLSSIQSSRFDAIFRLDRSASDALRKITSKVKSKEIAEFEPDVNPEKGFGEASRWARNLKDDLNSWRRNKLSWSEIDKGILIFGPSGTGKTMFAKVLARHLDVKFVSTSVTRWQAAKDGHLGDLLKAMYATFEDARNSAPCLVFLDELDSIGHRGRLPARWENYSIQVVNALLECLDGATGREGVIVVGACNYPDKIDPALLRSGRLEKHVHFPFPDAETRLEILEAYLPDLAGDERLRIVANRMPGKTGADINHMVREARRLARKGMRKVIISDLEYLIPKEQVLSAEEIFRVAVHESGHAIVANALGVGEVLSVEVFDRDAHHPTDSNAHGLTILVRDNGLVTPRSKLLAEIAVLLAGIVAEEIVLGERSNSSSGAESSDLDRATRLVMELNVVHGMGETLTTSFDAIDRHGMSELWKNRPLRDAANRLLQLEFQRVKTLLTAREQDIRVLAEVLAIKKKISGDELEAFLRSGSKTTRKYRAG